MSEKSMLTNTEFNTMTLKNGDILKRFLTVAAAIQTSNERPTEAQLLNIGLSLSRYKDVALPLIEQITETIPGVTGEDFSFDINQWKTMELAEMKSKIEKIQKILTTIQTLL